MDSDHFDGLTRTFALAKTRRAALGGLLAWGVAGVAILAADDAAAGKKKCPKGKKRCGGRCRNLKIDPANCGRCGNRCPTGGQCQNGSCTCPTGETDCEGTCVNLFVDAQNCGACGNDCIQDECFHGACSCEGENDCPAACTCGARNEGSAACFLSVTTTVCAVDDDCPLGAFCLVNDRCSTPCSG